MTYSVRIKAFRELRKLTHQQFADAVGVSRGSVQQWETGATAPKRVNQPVVAKFMGITASELMDELLDQTPADYNPNKPLAGELFNPLAINNIATIEQLMAGLSDYLVQMDDYARDNAADVLRRLTAHPEEHARAAALFATAFQSGKRKAA